MKIKNLVLILLVITILTNTTIISSQSNTTKFSNESIINIEEDQTIVLVTGFGPFGNFSINPSELIAAELDGEIINDAEIIGLPVFANLSNFSESIEFVYQAIIDFEPDYVVSIGLHGGSDKIQIEKLGINLKIESKEEPKLEILLKKGPFFKISPFPAIRIVRKLREENIPSKTSLFAGLSLCNGMLYSVINYIDVNDLQIKSGFVHVPCIKSEEYPEGMEFGKMVNATRFIIQVCLEHC